MTVPEPTTTEEERNQRILALQMRIEDVLRDTRKLWKKDADPVYLAALIVDAIGDEAAEMLANQTMLKGLRIENGVAILETEPARELMLVMVASLRTMLDDHGAENYLEMEIKAPCIAVDLQDGEHPEDAYTVTIQRRYRPTAHEFRQRAEARLARVREWADATEHGTAAAEVLALLGAGEGRG